jgi:hypothetical protein
MQVNPIGFDLSGGFHMKPLPRYTPFLDDNFNEMDSVISYQSAVRNVKSPLLRESASQGCRYRSYAEEIRSEEK